MCMNCEWDEYLEKVNDMLDSGDYYKSEEFLESVRDWIEEKEHVTDKQKKAIDEIQDSIF